MLLTRRTVRDYAADGIRRPKVPAFASALVFGIVHPVLDESRVTTKVFGEVARRELAAELAESACTDDVYERPAALAEGSRNAANALKIFGGDSG